MRHAVLLLMLAASASAQDPVLERARQALAAGDSARAHALVRDQARRGTDDAEVWRLRLRLELAGHGLVGIPRSFRHQQYVDNARAILRRAPQDTFALRVLTRDAVWNVLSYDDRHSPAVLLNPSLAEPGRGAGAHDITQSSVTGLDEETFRRAQTVSDFDIERRERMAPSFDLSGRAESATARALEYLETWLAAAPGSHAATAEALRLAVTAQSWDGALIVARAFQAASLDPRADLYAGLAHYRLGDAETAERVFERALARMTPAARTRFEAIDVLLRTEDQAAYAADPEGVTALFWAQTDPRLLTPVQERRAEHHARVVEADLLFSILSEDLFTITPPRGAETIQGQVWIRYGRPVRTASYGAGGMGFGTTAVWEYPTFRYVFDDQWRNGEFALYSPRADGNTGRDDYVIQDRVLRRDSPQQSQVAAQDLIGVPALVSRFRAADGGTEAVVAFGVPAELPGPVETGVFAVGLTGVLQRVVETHQALNAGRVYGGLWTDAVTVAMRGGERVQVEVEASDGAVRGRVVEEITPLSRSGGLAVSDLLLATSIDDGGRGLIVRDGIGIVPAARAVFPATDPVYLYLEAYGLGLEDGRTRYTVEATLTPDARRGGLMGRVFGRGQDPGVAVRTEAQGSRSDEAVTFFIDVRDQRAGDYTLRVEVADEVTGQTATTERRLVLE